MLLAFLILKQILFDRARVYATNNVWFWLFSYIIFTGDDSSLWRIRSPIDQANHSLRVRVRHGPPGHAWIAYGQDEDDAKSSCRNGPTIGMEKLLAKAAGRIRQCNSFWSASPYQSHALSMISRFSTPKPDPALCTGQDLCSDSRRRRRRRRQVMTAVWLLHVPVEMHPPHLH